MSIRNLRVRRMKARDVSQVVEIERQSFALPWTPEMFMNEIAAEEDSLPLVACLGERVAGYAVLWLVGPRVHLANIAVDEAFRRQGIGRLLVRRASAEARILDCRRVSLETRASNQPAINLFRGMGFRTVAVSRGYYTDNEEDALVMVRALGSEDRPGESVGSAGQGPDARVPE